MFGMNRLRATRLFSRTSLPRLSELSGNAFLSRFPEEDRRYVRLKLGQDIDEWRKACEAATSALVPDPKELSFLFNLIFDEFLTRKWMRDPRNLLGLAGDLAERIVDVTTQLEPAQLAQVARKLLASRQFRRQTRRVCTESARLILQNPERYAADFAAIMNFSSVMFGMASLRSFDDMLPETSQAASILFGAMVDQTVSGSLKPSEWALPAQINLLARSLDSQDLSRYWEYAISKPVPPSLRIRLAAFALFLESSKQKAEDFISQILNGHTFDQTPLAFIVKKLAKKNLYESPEFPGQQVILRNIRNKVSEEICHRLGEGQLKNPLSKYLEFVLRTDLSSPELTQTIRNSLSIFRFDDDVKLMLLIYLARQDKDEKLISLQRFFANRLGSKTICSVITQTLVRVKVALPFSIVQVLSAALFQNILFFPMHTQFIKKSLILAFVKFFDEQEKKNIIFLELKDFLNHLQEYLLPENLSKINAFQFLSQNENDNETKTDDIKIFSKSVKFIEVEGNSDMVNLSYELFKDPFHVRALFNFCRLLSLMRLEKHEMDMFQVMFDSIIDIVRQSSQYNAFVYYFRDFLCVFPNERMEELFEPFEEILDDSFSEDLLPPQPENSTHNSF